MNVFLFQIYDHYVLINNDYMCFSNYSNKPQEPTLSTLICCWVFGKNKMYK